MRAICENWYYFEEKIIPKQAGEIQRTEMKKAFYAGAGVIFKFIVQCVDDENISDEDFCEILNFIDAELKDFLLVEGLARE